MPRTAAARALSAEQVASGDERGTTVTVGLPSLAPGSALRPLITFDERNRP